MTIPESVTSIGITAFANCSGLTSVTIPTSVTCIGENTFSSCSGLTSVTIPEGVTTIGGFAFYRCSSLTSVTIPSSVTTIGQQTFYDCSGLTSVTIPEGVTTIDIAAFLLCSSLTSVTIPSSVTYIGDAAFTGTPWFDTYYEKAANGLFYIEDILFGYKGDKPTGNIAIKEGTKIIAGGALYECSGLTSVTIPWSVKSIANKAFYGCSGLTSVTIPASITSIGESAFSGCSGLTEVRSMIEEPFASNNNVFSSYDIPLYVPAGTKALYEATKGWKNFTNIVEMKNVKPEPYAVLSNDGKTVTFYYDGNKASRGGFDINNIYNESHPYCYVTTAVFDASFADYQPTSTAYWFCRCNYLTSITGMENLHTDKVTDMHYMFLWCPELKNLDVSGFKTDNVTNMGQMFSYCWSLTSLDVSGFNTDNVTNMGYMFDSCRSLTSLDLSSFKTDNVTDMWQMFSCCESLTSLDLSGFNTDNVTNMQSMFTGCSGLKTIYVGNGWSTDKVMYGAYMFSGCTSLVGGKGTAYDESHIHHTYARIDGGEAQPGYFTKKDLKPVNEGDNVNYGGGGGINDKTDLTGTVVNNMYYSIGTDAGGYSAEEGCIVITKETSDEQMELLQGLGITDEELNQNFTGIIFKVPAGEGVVKVNAETTGNMTLKVKVGNTKTVEMELEGKLKMKFPYAVDDEALVYIFAGTTDENAVRGAAEEPASLKIYGIEWQQTRKKGDLNGDGNVDVGDIMAIINFMAAPSGEPGTFDLNGDGSVDVGDIMAIINIMAQ